MSAWDRAEMGTLEELDNEMSHAEKDLSLEFDGVTLKQKLNPIAIANLYNELPTCNFCDELMQKQSGRFGVFYFCGNQCKGQKTVSDKYWQKIRRGK